MSAPTNKLSLDSLSPLDWYRAIRDQIQHVNIIPAVACLSDLLIYASVLAGVIALYRLRRTYSHHVAPGDFIPAIQGSRLTRWLGIASPLLLPPVFLAAWLWLWLQAHR